jgi:Cdc6-like AAA superfamily ATPase
VGTERNTTQEIDDMPNSKDILSDARKAFDKCKVDSRLAKEGIDQGTTDLAALAKARAEMATSAQMMKTAVSSLADRIKELNKVLTDLKKNETVMKAPIDARAYKELTGVLADHIRDGMQFVMAYDVLVKKAEKIL